MFWPKEWHFRQQETELREQFQQPVHVRVIPAPQEAPPDPEPER